MIVHFAQFEHALRAFHAGCRSRAPLYSDAFVDGVRKATHAVLRAIGVLEEGGGGDEGALVLDRSNAELDRFLKGCFAEPEKGD